MPVLGNVHPIKINKLIFFRDVISLLARVVILLIDTATQEVPMKNIWKKLSVQFLRYAIELLNAAHVKNDVKGRPIVTKFGTLIENMSRTGLYDCHIFYFIDNFMRISNFGIWYLHVKVKYWRIFVTSFLCSLSFLLFHRIEYPKRCLWKNNSITQFLWYDSTFKQKCTVPVTLTLTFFQWLEYNPIRILCKFQIDTSSSSREIKYQDIGRTHRPGEYNTSQPLRGRGK